MAKRTPEQNRAAYARRKAKAEAEGTTFFKKRNAAAQRLGYDSLKDQTDRRKARNLTHADQAVHAKREGGKYVDNLGSGRWTFATENRDPDALTLGDRARLQATLDRAWRADSNVTIDAKWRHPNGRTGQAQAGGSYGIRVRGFHDEGADALRSIERELASAYGDLSFPPMFVTSLNLFMFPSSQRAAA